MKIQGNLFRCQGPTKTLLIVLGVWLLAISMGALAVFLMRDTQSLRKQEAGLDAHLWNLQDQETRAVIAEKQPTQQEWAAMERRVQALNSITGKRGLDISELFTMLEEKLPNDVWLMSVHHRPRVGETMLVAESANSESLTDFMRKLELEPRLSQVLLIRRGSRNNKGKLEAIQFEIRARHNL